MTTSIHDQEAHCNAVVTLAERLRAAGVAKYEGPIKPDPHGVTTGHAVFVFFPPADSGLQARATGALDAEDASLLELTAEQAQKAEMGRMDRDLFGEPDDAE